MPLPKFNERGDLPEGIHRASLEEVLSRLGSDSAKRRSAAASLISVVELARATGALMRLIIFGSFVTSKAEPRDIDIILIMRDDFDVTACDRETASLFNHTEAENRFNASVFWIRPALLVNDSLADFIAHWQLKRDGTKRGIVELIV